MTYALESFLEKIESPIICVIDGKETRYENGKELCKQQFEKYYVVASIQHGTDAIIVKFEELDRSVNINWVGEEPVSFF